MKSDNLIILAAAAAALWLITSTKKQVTSTGYVRPLPATSYGGGTAGSLNGFGTVPVTEISNGSLPGSEAWGWRYYSDGTAIAPNGDYYYQGDKVYSQAPGSMGLGF